MKTETYSRQNKGEENVVNNIQQHIISRRKGYGNRAEKAEY